MPTWRAKAQVSTFKQAATNYTTSYANQQFILDQWWDSRRVYFPSAIQLRCSNQRGCLFVLESIFSAKQSETQKLFYFLTQRAPLKISFLDHFSFQLIFVKMFFSKAQRDKNDHIPTPALILHLTLRAGKRLSGAFTHDILLAFTKCLTGTFHLEKLENNRWGQPF